MLCRCGFFWLYALVGPFLARCTPGRVTRPASLSFKNSTARDGMRRHVDSKDSDPNVYGRAVAYTDRTKLGVHYDASFKHRKRI